jgi:competence protein ComEA
MSVFTREASYNRPLSNNDNHESHDSQGLSDGDPQPPPPHDDEVHHYDEYLDDLEADDEYLDASTPSSSPSSRESLPGHDASRHHDDVNQDFSSSFWGRVPPESRAFKAAARTGYRPGDDWRDLPRDPRLSPYPPPPRPRGDHPLAGARERLVHWLDDHLPATLQGRWRLDRRTGVILAAALTVVAVLVGGWTLFRGRSEQVAETRMISTGHHGSHGSGDSADDGESNSTKSGSTNRHGRSGDDGFGMNPDDPMAVPGSSANVSDCSDPSGADGGSWSGREPGTDPSSTQPPILIDVEGKVAKPGVQRLPAGSRVEDAVRAAGGALPGADLAPLNQARVLNDGEQVVVGVPQDPAAAPSPTEPRSKGRGKQQLSAPVHLNSATADQLEQLPGVGPAMAQRILDWRTGHGGFATVEQLREVRGLGGQRFAALRQWVQL